MRYLSTFSGIEAASVAWEPLGWEPVGFSEINPFAASVLAHRFPKVTNFGDITRYETWEIGGGAVDLLVGGSPCQSFSNAGKREGLNDPRGQLMFSYLGVARRFRPRWVVWENVPGVLSSGGGRDFGSLVGGLAKLGYGVAYRVLDAQWCRVDGYEKAVPQRRRRVFLVGCLGDARLASKVLFESQSVRRDPSSGREEGQGDTRFAEDGIGASVSENMIATPKSGLFSDGPHAVLDGRATASGNADSSGRTNVMAKEKPIVIDRSAFNQGSNALYTPLIEESDVMATLMAKGPHGVLDARATPAGNASWSWWDGSEVAQTITCTSNNQRMPDMGNFHGVVGNLHKGAISVAGTLGSRTGSGGGFSTDFETAGGLVPCDLFQAVAGTDLFNCAITGDVSATMNTSIPGPTVIGFSSNMNESDATFDASPTIKAVCPPAIAHTLRAESNASEDGHDAYIPVAFSQNQREEVREVKVPGALAAEPGTHQQTYIAQPVTDDLFQIAAPVNRQNREPGDPCHTLANGNTEQAAIASQLSVRRLTPRECERLQGFPDDWTLVPHRGKPAADGPRYKAIGNSMAVNVMRWIGMRIQANH